MAEILMWSVLLAQAGSTFVVYDIREGKLVRSQGLERARQELVRPGSTLKPFQLAAYIEAGLYGERQDGAEALAVSSNEFFAGLRMAPEEEERGYARVGLPGRPAVVTLDQLAQAYRRLVARHREARLRPVFAGMEKSVEYGTGRLAGVKGVKVAGKTGTTGNSALFVGYAPAEQPRYLVAVYSARGTGGGDAAPVAAKIFASLFPGEPVEAGVVSVRLFWQNPPEKLNLGPGKYGAGTVLDTGLTRLRAPGEIRVEKQGGRYEVTARVKLEDYVAGVLAGEAGGLKQEEARRAMAIAARSYAARFRGRHVEEGFDYCDTTHCQDARFGMEERADLRAAVEETSLEMLWRNGKVAEAYYHADSGGWIENRPDRWWKEEEGSRWRWQVKLPWLAAALGLSVVRPVFVVKEREASGRARVLDVFGHGADAAALQLLVGRRLGWDKMPSRLYRVQQRGDLLEFEGLGRGHGMGMAQRSAERMAEAGKKREEILAEYYPGARVSVTAAGLRWRSLRAGAVELWTTAPERDRAILGLAVKQLEGIERVLGMKAQPVVRVYPSREAFRDATGILEAVNGATRGRRVHLPPGVGPGTLRHELLHAVLESNRRGEQPGWLSEGLVQALNGEDSDAARRVRSLGVGKALEIWRAK
ncbi:MAG: SpoIID/LytB domain-containing protein [Acidobacteriota bacterium]